MTQFSTIGCKISGGIKNSSTSKSLINGIDKYKLNEEETWDLASHIVGMGKVIMDLVLRKPEIIFILQNIKQANYIKSQIKEELNH